MKKLNVKQKNWLISAHVAMMAIWFGTALSMIGITLSTQNTVNEEQLYGINSVMKLLDDYIIIPSANLSLLTGGLLCWLTTWGFFKHYWVIVKWILTVTLIVVGSMWLGPWTNEMTSISESVSLGVLQNSIYLFDQRAILIGGIIQTSFLLFIIVISFIKPWGKRDTNKQLN